MPSRSAALSPRLAAIVDALPLRPGMRVLEIGCGPGAAARAVARRIGDGHVLAIDRSAKVVEQARAGSTDEIAAGRLSVRRMDVEDFELQAGEAPYDIAFAIRVGALDGRYPQAEPQALWRIAAALVPGGRLFVDGGNPLREIALDPAAGAAAVSGGSAELARQHTRVPADQLHASICHPASRGRITGEPRTRCA